MLEERFDERDELALLAISCLTLLVAPVQADPWKDESGKGRLQRHSQGETPWWERGKGYWDGHFKHGGQWNPMPHCQPYIHGFSQHHRGAPLKVSSPGES